MGRRLGLSRECPLGRRRRILDLLFRQRDHHRLVPRLDPHAHAYRSGHHPAGWVRQPVGSGRIRIRLLDHDSAEAHGGAPGVGTECNGTLPEPGPDSGGAIAGRPDRDRSNAVTGDGLAVPVSWPYGGRQLSLPTEGIRSGCDSVCRVAPGSTASPSGDRPEPPPRFVALR